MISVKFWCARSAPASKMAVTPLAPFPCPPCHPPEGDSRPPPHQEVGRGRARAFLCSSPVTAPASFPSALGQGRRRPFPLPQGPAPPLLILARCFLSRPQVLGFPLVGCRTFVPLICLVGGRRCSRRGRAAASLPTGLVHRLPRLSPPPSLRSPSSVRAGLRSAPQAAWLPAPVRPAGAPSLPEGQAGRPLRGDRPAPPAFGTSPLPGPSADRRCALTALALRLF